MQKYLILVFILIQQTACKHILFLNLVQSPSHQGWNEILIEQLLTKNHKITMIRFDPKMNHPNYEVLQVDVKNVTHQNIDALTEKTSPDGSTNIKSIYDLTKFIESSCKYGLKTQQFKQFSDYPINPFNLIIIDITLSECFLPLMHHFGVPPTVTITTSGMYTYLNNIKGQKLGIVNHASFHGSSYKSFFERVYSTFYLTMESIIKDNFVKKFDDIVKGEFQLDLDQLYS